VLAQSDVTALWGVLMTPLRRQLQLQSIPHHAVKRSTPRRIANQMYVGSPTSRIYVDLPGVYNFQFSIQLDKASGASAHAYIWPRINGTDVPDSASVVAVQGTNAEVVAAWNFVLDLNGGDYFELMWAVDDINLHATAAAAAAPIPAIPSVILTVTFMSSLR
jgi:hypothetical protein